MIGNFSIKVGTGATSIIEMVLLLPIYFLRKGKEN